MKLQIIKTGDGSDTLFVPELNENYHSVNGALTESEHIFIQAGLNYVFQHNKSEINILEAGFGTGLNAGLTYLEAQKNKQNIFYSAYELYPLDLEIVKKLNYFDFEQKNKKKLVNLHETDWDKAVKISEYFTLLKIKDDIKNIKSNKKFDLVYFDAFAPEIQPDLWTKKVFENIFNLMNKNGVLVTYSSKGIVKQALRNAGFKVFRLSGPPGKRHILRANK